MCVCSIWRHGCRHARDNVQNRTIQQTRSTHKATIFACKIWAPQPSDQAPSDKRATNHTKSTRMASTNSTSSTSSAALAKVLKLQKSFPVELREKYSGRYAKLLQDMANDAGEFLHKKLHVNKHTEDQVRTVIKAFPAALSHLDDNGRLPIHSAVGSSWSIPFVTLLAKEGWPQP